jgi:ABC-2 type transport system permease protein
VKGFVTVARAMAEREFSGRMGHRLSGIAAVVSAMVTFVGVYYVGRLVPPELIAGGDYFTATVIGIGLYAFTATLTMAPRNFLATEIGFGSMETLLTLGHPVSTYVNAACVFQGGRALSKTIVTIAIAAWFGVDVKPAALLYIVPVFLLAGLAAAGLGYVQAAMDLRFRTASRVATLAAGAGTILSGVYFPVKLLPGPLKMVAELLPAKHAIAATRAALIEGTLPVNACLALAGLAAVYIVVGAIAFRIATRRMLEDGSFLA